MAWGRPPTCVCGTCEKCKRAAYMREWYRSKTPEERRAMLKQRDAERVRAADRRRHAEKRRDDPVERVKRRARRIAWQAVQAGRLVREACESCGSPEAQAHHDDYSKPLAVRWLCTTCHALEHRKAA